MNRVKRNNFYSKNGPECRCQFTKNTHRGFKPQKSQNCARFGTKKRFVLILDDLWETYSLKDAGILEPAPQNGCKSIVTTRSLDVCCGMDFKAIQMELLSEEEASKIFLCTVGHNVLPDQNLEAVLKEVVEECARLPLAVIITAASLKSFTRLDEWEIALEDLRESTKGSKSDGIFEKLKFSHNRLNDKRLQDCLLYCALYPEVYRIERNSLIHLVVEGIVGVRETRQSEFRRGQIMLDKLVDVCLLNDTIDSAGNTFVKMHDMVGDMSLQVTSESPRLLVKAGVGLKSVPDAENQKTDLVRASWMENDIIDIPSSIEVPKCPILLTFLMSGNSSHRHIADHFFLNLKGVSVLALSGSYWLPNLPNSVSDLVSLTAVFLRNCARCSYVPSLAKLRDLRKLDCKESGKKEVPKDMEMLIKLRYIDFRETNIEVILEGSLYKLPNLQYLSFDHCLKKGPKVRGEELEDMTKLETFKGALQDVNSFNTCVRVFEQSRPASYVRVTSVHFY